VTYQTLYRKWRPQTFQEVVGQEHIRRTLEGAVRSGRIAHAYLFCGPRGTGKTSMARILAKAVNCAAEPERRPCGECPSCQSIAQGSAIDLIEIDAASHTGVDNIRELREKVGFAPNEARYKVYVIDEVHMLSTSAFNAFLKTLEEPPPHAIFILATTDPQKVPPTVLSRCQRFDFHRIPTAEIAAHLERVSRAEGLEVEEEAQKLIARRSTGSLRDAVSMLDQLVAYRGQKILASHVRSILGLAPSGAVAELAGHIAAGRVGEGLTLIGRVIGEGVNPQEFCRQVVDYLRGLVLVKCGLDEELLEVGEEALSEMRDIAVRLSLEEAAKVLRRFEEASVRTGFSGSQSQLPLELALVEAALANAGGEAKVGLPALEPEEKAGLERVQEVWPQVLEVLENPLLRALLKTSRPLAVEDRSIVIGFRYPFHLERIEAANGKAQLEQVLSQLLGASYTVRCILAREELEEPTPARNRFQRAAEDPVIRAAIDMYGAQIADVTETMEDEAGGEDSG